MNWILILPYKTKNKKAPVLFYLINIDGQGSTVGKPVSIGSTHIFVPWLTSSSQQSHLPYLGHVCLENKFGETMVIFIYSINLFFIVLHLSSSILTFMPWKHFLLGLFISIYTFKEQELKFLNVYSHQGRQFKLGKQEIIKWYKRADTWPRVGSHIRSDGD